MAKITEIADSFEMNSEWFRDEVGKEKRAIDHFEQQLMGEFRIESIGPKSGRIAEVFNPSPQTFEVRCPFCQKWSEMANGNDAGRCGRCGESFELPPTSWKKDEAPTSQRE